MTPEQQSAFDRGYHIGSTWTHKQVRACQISSAAECLAWREKEYEREMKALKEFIYRGTSPYYEDGLIAGSRESLTKLQQEQEQGESIPPVNDFAELHTLLTGLSDEDREKVWVNIEKRIVQVIFGQTILFSAKKPAFVQAFFTLYGITLDEN